MKKFIVTKLFLYYFNMQGISKYFFYILINLFCLSPYDGNQDRYAREIMHSSDEAWVPFHAWYLIQNNPCSCKKVCGPKRAIVKKDVKSKVAAKKWL